MLAGLRQARPPPTRQAPGGLFETPARRLGVRAHEWRKNSLFSHKSSLFSQINSLLLETNSLFFGPERRSAVAYGRALRRARATAAPVRRRIRYAREAA
jgi:hypothetical protein